MTAATDSGTQAPVIDVRDVAKSYGALSVLEDVTFSIDGGEIFGIVGPNGAGKTTLVESIGGLREPDGGSIVFGLIWSGVIISTGMILNIAYTTVSDLQGTEPEMASSVWASLDAVTNGLGGGNEVLGGIWVLGISIVALRERLFARWINYLGVVMGVSALLTVVPALEDVGAVFGLGLIVWFAAVGSTLIKDHTNSSRSQDHQGLATFGGA